MFLVIYNGWYLFLKFILALQLDLVSALPHVW
jgi:hypothetical protein